MYEIHDPYTVMFFFRNKHIIINLGTGKNKIKLGHGRQIGDDWHQDRVPRPPKRSCSMAVSPKDYSTKHKYWALVSTGLDMGNLTQACVPLVSQLLEVPGSLWHPWPVDASPDRGLHLQWPFLVCLSKFPLLIRTLSSDGGHSTPLWLCLNSLYLQQSPLQIGLHSVVLGVRTPIMGIWDRGSTTQSTTESKGLRSETIHA